MKRQVGAVAVGCFCLLTAAITAAPAQDAPAGPWGSRADALIERAVAAKQTGGGPLEHGMMVVALGERYGWDHPYTQVHLNKLLSLQRADGGYGLGYAWDTWSDGRTNPASTAYAVSMAGHAGPALLAAYQAGVPGVEAPLERMIAKLWTLKYIPVTPGRCVAYSDNPNDLAPYGYCVPNVSAGVAAFLLQAWDAGIGTIDPSWLAAVVTQRTAASYNASWRNWTYSSGSGTQQDPPHMAYTLDSMMLLAPGLARNAVAYQLQSDGTHQHWPYAHGWLTAYDCELGAAWLSEFDQWAAAQTTFGLLAQAARIAAINAKECE